SADSEHAANFVRQSQRLRIRKAGKQESRIYYDRSLDSGATRSSDQRLPIGLWPLRISQGLSHLESILRGRPEQSLHRHHQGPDVLRRAGFSSSARYPNGDARDLRRALPITRTRSGFYRRGSVASFASRFVRSLGGISDATESRRQSKRTDGGSFATAWRNRSSNRKGASG